MKQVIVSFVLLLLIGLPACNNNKPEPKSSTTIPEKKAETKSVELHVVKLTELFNVIKSHKGKIVVVDVWSTGCAPCVEEFPHFVELQHKYEAKNVVCISVSLNESEQKESALKFLRNQKATTANYLVGDEQTELREAWDFDGIPVCRVYAPSGELAQQFTNDKKVFTYADVEPVVQKLLTP